MMRQLPWIGFVIALVTVASVVLANVGMAQCQTTRSFDVCHAAIQ